MRSVLEIHFPTEEELEEGRRFRTYLNYLFALSNYIESGEAIGLAKEIVDSASFRNIQGARCGDFEKLGRLLRNAWFTELQLQLPAEFSDFVPYANHWAPVQSYYSIYLALRAYFLASGQTVSHEHATNLSTISRQILSRPDLFPLPWRVLCAGDPETSLPQLIGLPPRTIISSVSCLSSPSRVSFWDSYALFLRTTRKRQLDLQCEGWKRQHHRKRIDTGIRRQFLENLSPTSIFHGLYRLRLRSNYSDADSFLLGVQDINESRQFHSSVCSVTWFSLLIFETLICRYIGKQRYRDIVNSFGGYDRMGLSRDTVGRRIGAFTDLW